jgi:hypothetical protein
MPGWKRLLTIVFSVGGAALLALAVQGGRWWQVGDVSVGPMFSAECFSGPCRQTDLGWMGGSDGWMRLGTATYVAGLCAAATAIFVAGAVAARRVPRLAAGCSLVSILIASAASVGFILGVPRMQGMAVGRGLLLFFSGLTMVLFAVVTILRAEEPNPETAVTG